MTFLIQSMFMGLRNFWNFLVLIQSGWTGKKNKVSLKEIQVSESPIS